MQKHKNHTSETASCIVTGEPLHLGQNALRIALTPDGRVFPDVNQEFKELDALWVTCRKKDILAAINDVLPTMLEETTSLGSLLSLERIERMLRKRALRMLSMAKKAGLSVNGYEKVRIVLEKGNAELLLQASDGTDDAKRKLQSYTTNIMVESHIFSREELSLALGSCNIVHVAVRKGNLALRLQDDIIRLRHFLLP